ncbi:ABC transporter permease/M1 family aminopeptidase [Haliscomenobacter hydrossis]|uniref:Peptidase M1 membrane alanine aminopeptidase domain-containing protein n=1 Tax=Haliscomenobacter hydrossis (strain ATCC 27775 / DSM 1100 / LMG 10767 / O) TaxID=760192 RepID=F4KZJ5_HALH1|nr:M1 family aminopeptidase [Haliscomenobacter hydrossis]AEE49465.1 hypothetical protein Halhy_1573 [Haliscomenobacter hydrossis DSM 1100]
MFWTVFSFELNYRLRRPATYIYFFTVLLLVTLIIANGGSPASEKVHHNSPAMIGSFFSTMGILSILICSAVMGVPLYRDLEHNTKEYLLSSPIRKSAYFWGRFWGSFAILVFICLGAIPGFMIGSWIGPLFDWAKPERYGPNHLVYYLWPFITLLLPSLFFSSCLFFGLVSWFRNNRILYTVSIMLFILYLLSDFLVRDIEKRDLVDLLDPFGINTYTNAIKYLTPAEQNSQLVSIQGNLLINRILWPSMGFLLLLLTYFRFSIQGFIADRMRAMRKSKKEEVLPAPGRVKLPQTNPVFNQTLNWSNTWNLGKLEFFNILRDPYFLSIILGGTVFLFLDDWIGFLQYGVPDRPLTMNMLLFKSYNYNTFVFIILIFYAGETAHRDQSTKFASIGDALPVPNWVQLGSKFMAITGVCFLLATVPMLIGVLVQVLRGFYQFKLHFYLVDLYLITFWDYFQMALLAYFVHALVNNKFVGHFVGMAIWIIMFIMRNFLNFDYNLFFYSYKPGYLISDMNNFGHFAQPLFWFNLYWTSFGLILLLFAALLWPRGSENTLRRRLADFRQAWNWRTSSGFVVLMLCWLGSAAFVHHNVSEVNHYRTSKEGKTWQAHYEKRYKKYERIPQPKVTGIKVFADVYPQNRSIAVRAVMKIQNKTGQAIDSLHLLSNDGQQYQLSFDGQNLKPAKFEIRPRPMMSLFYAKPDTGGYRIFVLPKPLAPGDSATLVIRTKLSNPGFVNNGYRREVIQNGTFTDGGLPSIGYNPQLELSSDEDRKKHKLPKKEEDLPPHRDPYGEKTLLFNDDADFITFECTISTVPDQIAIAPGYLQKEWQHKGRRYFHYVQDSKIDYFFNLVSARYTVLRDKWVSPEGKTVNIEIFHHHEHAYNLDRMVASLKNGLSYFEQHFGPYQFRQVRILEFPRYAGFAQSFPNTIPYSEDFGWYADFSDPNKYDYFYYVTAHELAHQWWGHQVTPNSTRGSNLISESLAEYSALMIAQKQYGRENLQRFLKYDLDGYLRGRASESKKENVFINCNRPYQWYQKGSLILYALQDYVGEEKLNGAIRAFRDSFALRETPPFAGSYDLYNFIKKVVPDSLQYYLEDSWLKIALYENRIISAKAKKLDGDRYEVTLKVKSRKMYADEKGNESEAKNMNDYIDIGVFAEDKVAKDGKKLTQALYFQKHRLKTGEHEIKVVVKGKPEKAGIDPYNKLIDRIPEDNRNTVDLE